MNSPSIMLTADRNNSETFLTAAQYDTLPLRERLLKAIAAKRSADSFVILERSPGQFGEITFEPRALSVEVDGSMSFFGPLTSEAASCILQVKIPRAEGSQPITVTFHYGPDNPAGISLVW
jgi:hypothetical protein